MSPATQEAFRALLRGLLKSGAITSRMQADVIIKEFAKSVATLEGLGHPLDARALEGLVADLTADFDT